MFCPRCGGEFREGIGRCPDCEVELTDAPPVDPEVELAVAGRTADPSRLAVWKSVLAAAGVPHLVQGDEVSGLFPLGPFGGGSPESHGRGGWLWGTDVAARVLVPAERLEEARELLEGVTEPGEPGPDRELDEE